MARVLSLLVLSASIWTAAQGQPDPSYADDRAFQDAILSAANRIRAEHGVQALTWNQTLADRASDWARQCRWRYSATPSGETLAMRFPNAGAAVESWGAQQRLYNYDRPGFSFDTNHFTQLVWRDSQTIGCARFDCGPPRPDDRPSLDRGRDRDPDDGHHDDYDEIDDLNDRDDDGPNDDRGPDDHDDGPEAAGTDDGRPDNDGDDQDNDGMRRRDGPDDDCHDDDPDNDDVCTGDGSMGDDDDEGAARGWYVVCQYSPPGNILGNNLFAANVLRNGQNGSGGNNGGNNNGGPNSTPGGNDRASGGSRPNGQGLNNGAVSGSSVKLLPLLGAVAAILMLM